MGGSGTKMVWTFWGYSNYYAVMACGDGPRTRSLPSPLAVTSSRIGTRWEKKMHLYGFGFQLRPELESFSKGGSSPWQIHSKIFSKQVRSRWTLGVLRGDTNIYVTMKEGMLLARNAPWPPREKETNGVDWLTEWPWAASRTTDGPQHILPEYFRSPVLHGSTPSPCLHPLISHHHAKQRGGGRRELSFASLREMVSDQIAFLHTFFFFSLSTGVAHFPQKLEWPIRTSTAHALTNHALLFG